MVCRQVALLQALASVVALLDEVDAACLQLCGQVRDVTQHGSISIGARSNWGSVPDSCSADSHTALLPMVFSRRWRRTRDKVQHVGMCSGRIEDGVAEAHGKQWSINYI